MRNVFVFSIGWIAAAVALARGGDAAKNAATRPARQYHVARTMHVGGEGRWDYVAVDSSAGLLYVPRQTHTQVLRAATGEGVADIPNTPGVHGVAIDNLHGRGFTSNGRGDSVTVFDLKKFTVLGTVAVGKGPD